MNKAKRRAKHSSLSKRARISYESKDQGGGGSRIIDWKSVDGDVKFFQPAMGRNAINIIPFEIKTKNHPLVKNGSMEIGELDYCLDIWTHRNVGPSESAVLCLKKTFGKACPICEEADKLRKAGKDKESGDLKASRRVIYNIEDTRKSPGEVQVFEVSHFLFEKELIDEARNDDEGDESFTDFADPETGSVVKFRCSKSSRGGFEFNEFKSFSFGERDDPLDDDLVGKAISFDEYLNIPTYEQAQEILYGADEDDDEDDEPKKGKGKPKPKKSSRHDEDDDDEEDDEDEEDDDPPPPKKGKGKPPAKSSGKSGKGKCPHGYTFGEDADEHEECEDCEQWAKCIGK
jgi:hypothetical protein